MKAIKDTLVAILALFSFVCLGVGLIHGAWHFFMFAIISLILAYSLLSEDDLGSMG